MIQLKGMGRRPRVLGALRCPPPEKAPTESTEKHGKDLRMCQYLHWPQRYEFPLGGSLLMQTCSCSDHAAPTLAKRCKRFTPMLAAPAALLLNQGEAKAILTHNIFESAENVVGRQVAAWI